MPVGEDRTRVLVSVDDAHAGDLAKIVERLRAAGLEVDRSLAALGTVTGSIALARLAELEAVEGVAAAEPARDHRLAPPESEIQ